MNTGIANLLSLEGKKAIVTGGAMGIGESIAEHLALAGADVLIVDIADSSEVQDSMEKVKQEHSQIKYFNADLNTPGIYEHIVKKAMDEFGDIHILVNNAGIFQYRPADQMTEDIWDRTMTINLKALSFLSIEFVKALKSLGHGGRIINISSVDSIHPTGNLSHYDSSKGGVNMFTKALAKEVGAHGITVNAIAPGGVVTPGVSKIVGEELSEEQKQQMQAQTKQFIQALPLKRMGQPEEIARIALFLASDCSSYMTGSIVVADGGLLLI